MDSGLNRSAFVVAVGENARVDQCDNVFVVPGFALGVRGVRATMAKDEESCAVVLGELHGRDELARELGVPAAAAFDPARLVLRAWQRWGDRSLDRLIGSFSGAFLDVKRRRLVAFRDLTASVPVYITRVQQSLVAGTDLAQVAGWAGRRLEPSPLFVASYLQSRPLDVGATAFEGVFAVAPGAVAVATASRGWAQRQVARWHVTPVRHRGLAEYVEHFAHELDAAVSRRLQGHSTAAVALSGGLDSTNVLASGTRVGPAVDWVAYAIPFQTPRGDERLLQEAVAAHCGARLEWLSVDGRGPLGGWTGELLGGRVAPPRAGNWFFGQTLAEAAHRDGIPVLFDGEDADSLLTGGRGYLSDLLVRGRWISWRRQARLLHQHRGKSVRGLLKTSVAGLLPPAVVRRVIEEPAFATASPIVATELAGRVNLAERLRELPDVRLWAPGRRFWAEQAIAGHPIQLGLVAGEVAEAFRSVDVVDAHPFFDRQLMTFCMGLPWQAVHAGTTPKLLLRELSKQRLPEVFNSQVRKANLSEYYDTAVFGVERDAIEAGLDLAQQRPEWVDPQALQRMRREFEKDKDSWMPSRVAMLMLWADNLEHGLINQPT